MGTMHSYGLDWIDEDKLFEVTKNTFVNTIASRQRKPLPKDPFTILAHAIITKGTLSKAIDFEYERSINKTLSGSVGYWHQRVLGLSPNWIEMGAAGGSIDLKTVPGYEPPNVGFPVFAEVKNRFNTIKGSDEKNTWDKLDSLSRANNAVCYVFQVVPKMAEAFDKPWKVSGRNERDKVRHCDGVTAYAMVFERPTALFEIYKALPTIFEEITESSVRYSDAELDELFFASLPTP